MRSTNSNFGFEMPKLKASNASRNHGRPKTCGNSFPHSEIANLKSGCGIPKVGKT
jgi:hypothetical protein